MEETASGPLSGSTLLSLSLFIILLAFFIVLNAVSTFEEQKVEDVFDSLDLAFDTNIIPTEMPEQTNDDTSPVKQDGGDSVEDVQATLRSILPGLAMELTDSPDGGKEMAILMKKDKFEKLSPQLIPVFVRLLNIPAGEQQYRIEFLTSVRDPLSSMAEQSFDVIHVYKEMLIEKNIAPSRVQLSVQDGNPAFLMIKFSVG